MKNQKTGSKNSSHDVDTEITKAENDLKQLLTSVLSEPLKKEFDERIPLITNAVEAVKKNVAGMPLCDTTKKDLAPLATKSDLTTSIEPIAVQLINLTNKSELLQAEQSVLKEQVTNIAQSTKEISMQLALTASAVSSIAASSTSISYRLKIAIFLLVVNLAAVIVAILLAMR